MLLCVKFPHLYRDLAAPDHDAAQPLIVVDRYRHPALVLDANDAALQRGVQLGATEAEAFSLCGEGRFVALDAQALDAELPRLLELFEGFSPDIEVLQPTDYILDLGRIEIERARSEAQELMQSAPYEVQVGLASNRFVAQLAAQSPGLHVIPAGEEARFVGPHTIHCLPVSAELRRRLELLGIHTLAELRALPARQLTKQFAALGKQLADWAQGQDSQRISAQRSQKIYEGSYDFEIAASETSYVMQGVEEALTPLFSDMKGAYLLCSAVQIRLELEGGGHEALEVRFASPLDDTQRALKQISQHLNQTSITDALQRVRLRLDGLVAGYARQLSLLPLSEEEERRQGVQRVVDRLRSKASRGSLMQVVWADRESRLPERRAFLEDLVHPSYRLPLSMPRPAKVATGLGGYPSHVAVRKGWIAVDWLMETWEIDDEWWTDRPVMRSYYRVVLKDGQILRLFKDLREGGWYRQQV